jgi:hypothetical protein
MTIRTAKASKATIQTIAAELGTITKDNVAAVVASGNILGAGLKELGKGSVAESRAAASTLVADLKAFAKIKSPAELFALQFKLAQRNLDTALALGSRNGKALGKLAGDAAAPISSQVKDNLAKLRKAA